MADNNRIARNPYFSVMQKTRARGRGTPAQPGCLLRALDRPDRLRARAPCRRPRREPDA